MLGITSRDWHRKWKGRSFGMLLLWVILSPVGRTRQTAFSWPLTSRSHSSHDMDVNKTHTVTAAACFLLFLCKGHLQVGMQLKNRTIFGQKGRAAWLLKMLNISTLKKSFGFWILILLMQKVNVFEDLRIK